GGYRRHQCERGGRADVCGRRHVHLHVPHPPADARDGRGPTTLATWRTIDAGSNPGLDRFERPAVQVLELVSVGRFSVGVTFRRIHIPARPWPGTAQKIM